jgi:Na+/H+ antiporter NhaD/arsenite permease-like protein
MLFLFGMFIVGQALEDSGYLAHISYRLFSKVSSVNYLIFCIMFGMGIASSFLMNDTLAIIGTPVVLMLSRQKRINPKLMLVTLAFSVTIGSVMSPIGNLQNLFYCIDIQPEKVRYNQNH